MCAALTLTRTVVRTMSDAADDVAFTEMGISPRTSGLMGTRTDAPPWLPTDTRRTLGMASSSLSGKTNSNVSLCATITMTWRTKDERVRPDHMKQRSDRKKRGVLLRPNIRLRHSNELLYGGFLRLVGHRVLRGGTRVLWEATSDYSNLIPAKTPTHPVKHVQIEIQHWCILLVFHCDIYHTARLIRWIQSR